MSLDSSIKEYYKINLVIGIIMILFGFSFIFMGDYNYAYAKIILGLSIIIWTYTYKPKITWKKLPAGMKAIVIFLFLKYFLALWNIYTANVNFDVFFGIVLFYPVYLIKSMMMILISLITIIAIFKQSHLKLILWLQGFSIADFIAGGIWIILTPISTMIKLRGAEETIQIVPALEILAKSIVLIPIFFGLIISIVIWIYLYKSKDYFKEK